MLQIDRTELFGSVTCVTGIAGCGPATTTVSQQIVPTVQVRPRLAFPGGPRVAAQAACALWRLLAVAQGMHSNVLDAV